MTRRSIQLVAGAAFVAAAGITAFGSSHREAPAITGRPKLDGTDFYMFRSYEPGRQGYVTLIANYIPLQDAYGGPNFFALDPQAVYEIHVDNNGDAREDVTFQFRFHDRPTRTSPCPAGGRRASPVPLINVGGSARRRRHRQPQRRSRPTRSSIVRGDRRNGDRAADHATPTTGNQVVHEAGGSHR